MTTEEALKHFKTRAEIARVAMVTRQAVAQWFKLGLVPPRSAELLKRAMAPKKRA